MKQVIRKEHIKVGAHDIEVRRKSIKNMYLRIYPPDGSIVLTAPVSMTNRRISEFVLSRKDWIVKQKQSISARSDVLSKEFIEGEEHYFEGKKFFLEIKEYSTPCGVVMEGDRLIICLDSSANSMIVEKCLYGWYRKKLLEKIPVYNKKWSDLTGLKVNEYRIRRMKSRWGSCNIPERRICLNLELAKYDDTILEYILLHEILHLIERKHNKRFYMLMEKFMPEWKYHRDILKGRERINPG